MFLATPGKREPVLGSLNREWVKDTGLTGGDIPHSLELSQSGPPFLWLRLGYLLGSDALEAMPTPKALEDDSQPPFARTRVSARLGSQVQDEFGRNDTIDTIFLS